MFNWFWKFLYGLIKVPLFCIDVIMMIARKLCGIDPIQVEVTSGGEVITQEVDLLTYFLEGEEIVNAFGYVCLFGIILLFLFTVFRIIKDQGVFYEKKSPLRICVESAKILLYFMLVPTIMILGSAFISAIMRGIYEATANGNSGLGGAMFVIFAEEAYIGPAGDKQEVLDAFRTCSLEAYVSGTNMFSYYNTNIVSQYFNLSEINFFLGFVGSISVLILLALTLLSFVERIISLVLLFIISPLPMSASPLDDGERFKIWREQTINKFITAYGGLLALNIFALMLPMITNINFFSFGGFVSNVANGIARLLFVIGGAFACRRGMVLIGNLVSRGAGSQDLMDQSHMSGGLASLARFASGAIRGAWGMVSGTAKAGVRTGMSMMNAAGIPTTAADIIKKKIAEAEQGYNPGQGGVRHSDAATRFSDSINRNADQKNTAVEAAMRGKPADSNPNSNINTPKVSNDSKSAANNDKNTEMNKNAQNDIKNALQNKKTEQPKVDSDKEK